MEGSVKRVGTLTVDDSRNVRFTKALRIFQEMDNDAAERRKEEMPIFEDRRHLTFITKENQNPTQRLWTSMFFEEEKAMMEEHVARVRAAIAIQRVVRGFLQRKYLKKEKFKKIVTGFVINSGKEDAVIAGVVRFQALVRGHIARNEMQRRKEAVAVIEAWYRRMASKRIVEKRKRVKTDHRRNLIAELVTSEQRYLESMEKCVQVFIRSMIEMLGDEDAPFTANELDLIFENYEDFPEVSRNFLEKLNSRLDSYLNRGLEDDGTIIFSDLVSEMLGEVDESYIRYCAFYPRAYKVLREKIKNIQFALAMRSLLEHHLSDVSEEEDIFSFLALPLARIPRYELLLKEIVKFTVHDHSDLDGLQLALSSTKSIRMNVNRISALLESFYRIIELQETTKGISGRIIGPTITEDAIIEGSHNNMARIFLESEVIVYSEREGRKKCRGILMTSELLLLRHLEPTSGLDKDSGESEDGSTKFELVSRFSLLAAKIEDDKDSAVNFHINISGIQYRFTCENPREKEQWVKISLALITRAQSFQSSRKRRDRNEGKINRTNPLLLAASGRSSRSFVLQSGNFEKEKGEKKGHTQRVVIVVPLIQLRRVMIFSTEASIEDLIVQIKEKLEVCASDKEHVEDSELYYPVGGVWLDMEKTINDYGLHPLEELEFKPVASEEYVTFNIQFPQMALKLRKNLHPRCKVRDLIHVLIDENPEIVQQTNAKNVGVESFRVYAVGKKNALSLDDIVAQRYPNLRVKFIYDPSKATERPHDFEWSYSLVRYNLFTKRT